MDYNKAGKYTAFLVMLLGLYLSISFCNWELNPIKWEVVSKLAFCYLTFIVASSAKLK